MAAEEPLGRSRHIAAPPDKSTVYGRKLPVRASAAGTALVNLRMDPRQVHTRSGSTGLGPPSSSLMYAPRSHPSLSTISVYLLPRLGPDPWIRLVSVKFRLCSGRGCLVPWSAWRKQIASASMTEPGQQLSGLGMDDIDRRRRQSGSAAAALLVFKCLVPRVGIGHEPPSFNCMVIE